MASILVPQSLEYIAIHSVDAKRARAFGCFCKNVAFLSYNYSRLRDGLICAVWSLCAREFRSSTIVSVKAHRNNLSLPSTPPTLISCWANAQIAFWLFGSLLSDRHIDIRAVKYAVRYLPRSNVFSTLSLSMNLWGG